MSYGLRFGPNQVQEMARRYNANATYKIIAHDFGAHEDTVRKYIRAWELYGESFWSDCPVKK